MTRRITLKPSVFPTSRQHLCPHNDLVKMIHVEMSPMRGVFHFINGVIPGCKFLVRDLHLLEWPRRTRTIFLVCIAKPGKPCPRSHCLPLPFPCPPGGWDLEADTASEHTSPAGRGRAALGRAGPRRLGVREIDAHGKRRLVTRMKMPRLYIR